MGYLYLALSLVAGGIKGFCGKKTSRAIALSSDSMVMNVLRMVFCVVIGFFLVLLDGNVRYFSIDVTLFWITLLSGTSLALSLVCWLLSVKSGAYMMVEIFMLIGVSVTVVLCCVFFNESVSLRQTFGMLTLFVASYIMCTYNTSIKKKMNFSSFLLLILCGVSNGISDFSQKLFVKICPGESITVFNLYTYLFAGVVLFFASLVFRHIEKNMGADIKNPFAIVKHIWFYVLIMAACLFTYSFFKTKSAEHLDAVLLYPLSQGLAIINSLFLSSVFFKERINLRCSVGIVLSFVALLFITFENF